MLKSTNKKYIVKLISSKMDTYDLVALLTEIINISNQEQINSIAEIINKQNPNIEKITNKFY